ncbi:MAG: hypothetical protein WDO73_26105 [Ignavibacteriota bacterium]
MSYPFFQSRFGGDPHRLGGALMVGGKRYNGLSAFCLRISICRPCFRASTSRRPDIWLPMSDTFAADPRGRSHQLRDCAPPRRLDSPAGPCRDGRAPFEHLWRSNNPKIDTGFSASVFPAGRGGREPIHRSHGAGTAGGGWLRPANRLRET